MSLFSSLKSDATTVLLWGDRWWLPRHRLPVPFADPGQAAALLAAAWPGGARRLRLIYQPDDFVTVPVACPQADRATLGLVLAEEHPALAHPGLAWGFEPILGSGDGFGTLLHHESRPGLYGLVYQLQEQGFTVDSAWPLASWLNVLPPDLSDTGAMTILALSPERFHLYRHAPDGVRSVQSAHGKDSIDRAAESLRGIFGQSQEFVLHVTTDDALLDALNQRLKIGGDRVVGHFAIWEALAKSAVLNARHPAQLLPPAAALWPSRLMRAASGLALVAGLVLAGEYVHRHHVLRQEAAALAREIPALRQQVTERRQAVAALAAERAGAARPAAWCSALLRAAGRAPAPVTLTALHATPADFVLTGGVTAAGALTEPAWREWLARIGGETWRVEPAALPAGAVTLKGRR